MGLPPSLRWLPLAALLVVLAVRASYWAELERSPLSLWHLWEETDEHAFLEWSARLAGDWRDVPAFRAYFHWQEEIGSRADWDGWYERNAYYSGPLYPYGLALLRVLFRDPVLPARGLQIALAVAATAVLAVAVRRVLGALGDGPAAAGSAVAALLYGLYGPLVFHDGFALRDGPVTHLSTLLVALPLLPRGGGTVKRAFGVGLLGGAAMLVKQTVAPVAVASVLVAGGGRRRILGAGLLGLAIPLGILAARNLSAGVPPLTFDTRQAVGLAWGDGRGADGSTAASPALKAILVEAKGKTLRTALIVLRGWRDDPMGFVRLMGRKLATFFSGREIPDNASFDFFRDRLPLLAVLPVFACLLGPGLVGLAAAGARRILTKGELALAAVGILAPLASCLLVMTSSRYRTGAAGPLALGAGLLAGMAAADWREGRRALAGALAGASLAVSGIALFPPPIPVARHRWADACVYATLVEGRLGPAAAEAEVARYMREGRDDPNRKAGVRALNHWLTGDRSNTTVAPEGIAPPDRRVHIPQPGEQYAGEEDEEDGDQ